MKYEDANCSSPCGLEPMGCSDCPEMRGGEPPYNPDDFLPDGWPDDDDDWSDEVE